MNEVSTIKNVSNIIIYAISFRSLEMFWIQWLVCQSSCVFSNLTRDRPPVKWVIIKPFHFQYFLSSSC
uniref:Uncharacterized protein n=1 Tax=Populus trichocarpa TaxID=3694 RepID=A0A2K2AB88_POPTR